MNKILKTVEDIFNYEICLTDVVVISVKHILVLIITLIIAKYIFRIFKKTVIKRLEDDDENKFDTVFSFSKWLLYIVVILITLDSMGVGLKGLFTSTAALLIGVGMALQTWFQDIMSGVFIIIDKSLHIGDVVEIDGKVGKVTEIRLRTTRAITKDNKVLIIPNHLYLKNILFNWTQNGTESKADVAIGVAYGSDVEKVKKLLLNAVDSHPKILKTPEPFVLFENFGDSALEFRVVFSVESSIYGSVTQSDVRFKVDELFREHGISIPFPQRDIHLKQKNI